MRKSRAELVRTVGRLSRSITAIEQGEVHRIVTEKLGPIPWAQKYLKWKPYPYQAKLLEDTSKRIAVRMCRQSGKTETISVRAIHFASTNPKSFVLIVAPSLRQSMIVMDRVQSHLFRMEIEDRRNLCQKIQRTTIRFKNGSQIVALPNSPNLLRGYTADLVILDEMAFFQEDQKVVYNIIYPMLATTDGILLASSTPWGKDSVFYKMCTNDKFSNYHISWKDVVDAGLIKVDFIEEMRASLIPERFRREFDAEFVEEAHSYYPTKLITQCINADLDYWSFDYASDGEFYVGVDLGKRIDHTVVAVVQKIEGQFILRHLHQFPLETPYASVIGYIKTLCGRYNTVRKVMVDQTGVGDYIVEDMIDSGIIFTEGLNFTLQSKEALFGYTKQKMMQNQLAFPYDTELIGQINVEEFETLKSGHIRFFHPEGTHDDQLCALALSLFGTSARVDISPPIMRMVG